MAPLRRLLAALAVLAVAASAASAAAADDPTTPPAPITAVTSWNSQALQRVRDGGIQSQIAGRVYALVHLAQLAAVDPAASEELAAAQAAVAAHTALNLMFPWKFAEHDAALEPFLAGLSEEEAAAATAAGRAAGIAVVKDRLSDGLDRYAGYEPYPADGPVGKYQFVPGETYALYPQLANTRTILLPANLSTGAAWGLAPHAIPSDAYHADLEETFALGRANSTARSQEMTQTVYFWADLNQTAQISGHWNEIAQAVLPANASVAEAARLFAALNAAIFDSSVVCWNAKYTDQFWRPITAIRQGDGTGQDAELVDPQWTPELSTPPHPEYPSGHSQTAGAAAGVLIAALGDDTPFTIGTEAAGLQPRTFASFTQAVEEVNDSRVLGGVHFRKSVEDGARLGRQVAAYVYDRLDGAGQYVAAEA